MNRKITLLSLLIFFLPHFSFAQDTTRCVVIQHILKGKTDSSYGFILLKVGDPVMVRTTRDHHLQTGAITAITDSTIELSSIHSVNVHDITEIRWDPKDGREKRRSGAYALSSLGSLLFTFYEFSRGQGSRIGLYITGGFALVTIAVVVYLTYRGGQIVMKQRRHFKSGAWKLVVMPEEVAAKHQRKILH